MSPLTWAAIGLALLLVPVGDPVGERLRVLGVRGRLHLPGSHARRSGPTRRWTPTSAPVAGGVALVVVTVRAGPVLGVAAALVAATAARLLGDVARARAAERSAARLLAGVRVLVAELSAGAAPDVALLVAAEMDGSRAAYFLAAADAVRTGGDVAAAVAEDPDLVRVGQAWSVARRTGAPMAAVLERVVADLVARREHGRSVDAALAGPRSSAAVLAVLPVLGILLGVAMDAEPLTFLFGSSAGQVVCLAGVGLDVVGLAWTRRLAARAATA